METDNNQTQGQPNTKASEDNFFSKINAGSLTDEEKGEILAKMMELAQGNALLRIYDTLSDEQKTEMDRIAEQDDMEVIEEFFNKIPGYEQILNEEFDKIMQEMIVKYAK